MKNNVSSYLTGLSLAQVLVNIDIISFKEGLKIRHIYVTHPDEDNE